MIVFAAPVVVTSTDPGTDVYVAPGADVPDDVSPDPFKKVGVAGNAEELKLDLAPGAYTMIAESASSSTGHTSFKVLDQPLKVDVRAGNATVKTLGGIFIGLGITSVVAGIVALVSLPNSTTHVNKFAIGGALIGGGLGGFGLGLGLTFIGRTQVIVGPLAR